MGGADDAHRGSTSHTGAFPSFRWRIATSESEAFSVSFSISNSAVRDSGRCGTPPSEAPALWYQSDLGRTKRSTQQPPAVAVADGLGNSNAGLIAGASFPVAVGNRWPTTRHYAKENMSKQDWDILRNAAEQEKDENTLKEMNELLGKQQTAKAPPPN